MYLSFHETWTFSKTLKPLNTKSVMRVSVSYQNYDIFVCFFKCFNQFSEKIVAFWREWMVKRRSKNIAAEMPLIRPVIEHYTFMAFYNVLIDGNKRNWNTIPDAWDVPIVWGFQPLTYSTWVLSTHSACGNVRKTINNGTNEWCFTLTDRFSTQHPDVFAL